MKKIIIVLILVGLAAGGGVWYYRYSSTHNGIQFRTTAVERGDLLATINATGTIEPEEVVDVGSQVVGQITSFGRDPRDNDKPLDKQRPIDYSTPVDKDTVLAKIDDAVYQAQLDQAKAQLAQAQATVQHAEADLGQMQARVYQSDRDWARAQQLGASKYIAGVDYDTAEATARVNKATLAVGEATLEQAKAGLKSATAALHTAEINLGYCTIKSPVKGVIVDRRVNVGQTVVSSLNAPSLFLIAKDLKRLQVWASVNEADVGHIRPGQPVTFTVDAYPGQVFKGAVAPDQPRLNASMTQNVVTYTVAVLTDNPDLKLKPYMTANLQFEVDKKAGVLTVPNAALRWRPTALQVAADVRDDFIKAQRRRQGVPGEVAPAPVDKQAHNRGSLWVVDNGFVRSVKVHIGLSDGLQTEITDVISGDLKEGTGVVVGEMRANAADGGSNPFTPQLFNNKKPQ